MSLSLTQFAKAGFTDLSGARELLESAVAVLQVDAETVLELTTTVADPDRALTWLVRLAQSPTDALRKVIAKPEPMSRLLAVLGGSRGLAEFIERRPETLALF